MGRGGVHTSGVWSGEGESVDVEGVGMSANDTLADGFLRGFFTAGGSSFLAARRFAMVRVSIAMMEALRMTMAAAFSTASGGEASGIRDKASAMLSGPLRYFQSKLKDPRNSCHRACLADNGRVVVEKKVVGL